MLRFFEILETLKRAVIAIALFTVGLIVAPIVAQFVFEACMGTLTTHWWSGANGWFAVNIAGPWIGRPLSLALFLGYLVYLYVLDEAAELRVAVLAPMTNQQEQTDSPWLQLLIKPAGDKQALVFTEQGGADERT